MPRLELARCETGLPLLSCLLFGACLHFAGIGAKYISLLITPDLMFVTQSWGITPWNLRKQKAVFRGRDSNPARIEAARSSVSHKDILDAKITSWERDENFEAEEELGGGAQDHIQLRDFSKYKYIVGIDGTVAAYRTPYLLFSKTLMLVLPKAL